MTLEVLINDYIGIPADDKDGLGPQLNIYIDGIAVRAKYHYLTRLNFYIADLVRQENDLNSLKYLIEKFGPMLKSEHKLIVCLYKRYLTLNPTNEQYYKDLANIIIFYRSESEKLKARKMYQFAQAHNYDEAAKVLDSINY
jgi:hypothetical protein